MLEIDVRDINEYKEVIIITDNTTTVVGLLDKQESYDTAVGLILAAERLLDKEIEI